MCSTDSLKVEVVYEKPFRITDRGHKQEVENEERKFLQVRVSHSVEGDLLITDDLHQLKDFLHVIGVRIGSVYTEMNYETDDTLLGIFIYNPIKPVIFKEYKVGGINK
ncbi:transcriptional regulator, partial [Bacillus thuringiensis]|nr:transcriptional regulator [Bacillus thuringiensis]